MNYRDYVEGIRFRFFGPNARPDDSRLIKILGKLGISIGRFHWILIKCKVPMEIANTILPSSPTPGQRRVRQLCAIPKMSTYTIGALINYGISKMQPDTCFVNVGVWNGFTFLSGIVENAGASCIAIDNFSEFGGPREAFLKRFEKYRSPNHVFYEMDYRAYFEKHHKQPIGFYIYDGEHSYENQLEGLRVAEPFLAKGCIILVDDTAWEDPRRATLDFIKQSNNSYEMLLDAPTCCANHPTYWNGIMIFQKTT